MKRQLRNLFASVQKPYRLIGGEAGSRLPRRDDARVRVCLAFPDVYDIGMSNVGLAILRDIVNAREGWLAERVYAPWADAEEWLRAQDAKLFSLESRRELCAFDIVGFSLPHELTYTTVLMMLDLGGIALRSRDRGDNDPLVIAGGPCAFNPEPMAAFFDAIVVGDGESALVEIIEAFERARAAAASRADLLDMLAALDGVYVPSRGAAASVRKAIVADLDCAPYPELPIAAHAAVQDRAVVEIQRGCVRGCRFCQAGMVYRPVRQRAPKTVQNLACAQLAHAGYEEASMLSLSVGDYECLEDVVAAVGRAYPAVNFGLPSLRAETLTAGLLSRLGMDRAGSFTFAPEAATERMRALINKGNTDDDLYAAVEKVFCSGFSKIKLYFMVGLPSETSAEIDGIVAMAKRCLDIGRRRHRRPEVTVSTSTFVPKPHTPLQWSAQIGVEETLAIQRELKRQLRGPGLYYRWHHAEMSRLEGILCRGGRELAGTVERAYRVGARFDGWDECFDAARWEAALAAEGIRAEEYLRARRLDERLPWDHIYAQLKREFLAREYARAMDGVATPSCVHGACAGCGVCDFDEVKNRAYAEAPLLCKEGVGEVELPSTPPNLPLQRGGNVIVRIRFSKTGRAAFLGHLELMDALRKMVRRARLPLALSLGYHPRLKMSMGRALPVGIESRCEYLDIALVAQMNPADLLAALNAVSPQGIDFCDAVVLAAGAPSIDESIVASCYEIDWGEDTHEAPVDVRLWAEAVDAWNAAASCELAVERKGVRRTLDLKGIVGDLAVDARGVIRLTLSHAGSSVKVPEAVRAIVGLSDDEMRDARIVKTSAVFAASPDAAAAAAAGDTSCPMN